MIGKLSCSIIGLAFIIVSGLLSVYSYYNFESLDYTSNLPLIWIILYIVVFPVLLHICYLNSKFNPFIAFILSVLTSVICFFIDTYAYYLRVNFNEYLVRASDVIIGLFITSQIIIGSFFAIIHFVVWWKSKR